MDFGESCVLGICSLSMVEIVGLQNSKEILRVDVLVELRKGPFKYSLTANIILSAINLRYTITDLIKSSQFSHKQLVLVATPVSTGVYFFIYLPMQNRAPNKHPMASAVMSPRSNERPRIKYF